MFKHSFSRLVRIVNGANADDSDEPLTDATLTRLEKFVHFWVLVWDSFVRNRCPVRASALSYATLLAIIPMLAVAMSVSSVFLKTKGEEQIKTFIEEFVNHMVPTSTNSNGITPDPDGLLFMDETPSLTQSNRGSAPIKDPRVVVAQEKAASYIHEFIQNTYSGTLGVTGVIFLLVTAILMLTRIEETFNDIWGVSRGRNWLARIVLYWATITLAPILLIGALGLASGSHFENTRGLIESVPYLEPIVSQLLPVAIICLTFALFYKLMPNTKVNFTAALVGGVLAGTAWHFYNLLGFVVASRVASASKIYGGLALIPLLMGGLYVVWLTVLFGAQVAYAFQNRAAYLQDRLVENVNQRGREFIALRLMTCISQRFQRGEKPATVTEMSGALAIPSRLIQQVLRPLLAARLVIEAHSTAEPAYAPARPLADITAHDILLALRAAHGHEVVTRDEPERNELLGEFARIEEAEKTAASAVSMLALVHRAQARPELTPPAAKLKPIAIAPDLVEAKVNGLEDALPIETGKPMADSTKSGIASATEPTKLTANKKADTATPDEERGFPL